MQRTKYILVVNRLLVVILGDITFYLAEIQPAAKSGHCSQRSSAAIKRAGGIARTWRKELMKHGGYHTQDGGHRIVVIAAAGVGSIAQAGEHQLQPDEEDDERHDDRA